MDVDKEKKRTMGEIACAECRRLKSRCDKQVPCSTCIKRGCEILCPNSTMPPGEGSRFVAVAETYLRRKIAKMEERMRSLEDALAIIQGPASYRSYPTPTETWQNRETKWMPEVNHDPIMGNEFIKYGLIDVFGSLYLDEGPPYDPSHHDHNPESLLLQAKAFISETSFPSECAKEDSSYLPPEIDVFYTAFPFTPTGIPTKPVQDLIESYLPPLPRAMALCETFSQFTPWMFCIVSWQTVFDEMIPTVYKHAGARTTAPPKSYGPHDLALLFIVFAIGALLDPSLPPNNEEGQHYQILSRAALCLQPVFTQRSVVTVKVLHLMSTYNAMCGTESKLQNSCSLLSLAAQVALHIGFYRDPSVWKMADREAYERRVYFWNLVNATIWQSIVSGQPPAIIPSSIDCRIPTEEEENLYQVGEVPIGFGTWSFKFTLECVVPVMEATQSVCPPSYDSILALDCKIREFSVPPALSDEQMPEQMQAYIRSQLREMTLLFLHRSYFAQAVTEFPWDPLRSPHRQSFLSAYQSAIEILRTSREQFARQPTLCSRIWRFWTFAFLSTVIIATVAIRQLSIDLEPEPFRQLDLACALFQEAAETSVRARMALPILLRLRQEAFMLARREPPHSESGKPRGSQDHREVSNSHGTSMDTSSDPTQHPMSSIARPGAFSTSSSKYMQALPVPVMHPPLAKIAGHDERHVYSDIPSTTNLGTTGLVGGASRQSSSTVRSTLNDAWNPDVHNVRPY